MSAMYQPEGCSPVLAFFTFSITNQALASYSEMLFLKSKKLFTGLHHSFYISIMIMTTCMNLVHGGNLLTQIEDFMSN